MRQDVELLITNRIENLARHLERRQTGFDKLPQCFPDLDGGRMRSFVGGGVLQFARAIALGVVANTPSACNWPSLAGQLLQNRDITQ